MKLTAILFTLFIITVIVLADRGQLGGISFLYDFSNGDKLGHFILYGLLNFFLTRAFISSLHTQRPKPVALSTGLILILFIAAEEWSQQFFATRTMEWFDLFASIFGVLIGGWLAVKKSRARYYLALLFIYGTKIKCPSLSFSTESRSHHMG